MPATAPATTTTTSPAAVKSMFPQAKSLSMASSAKPALSLQADTKSVATRSIAPESIKSTTSTSTQQSLTARALFEVLLGITGKDFVLTASDDTCARGIVVQKRGEDKSRALNKNNLMLFTGEAGDTTQFAEYIQCNTQLYRIRNGMDLSTRAVSSYVRKELATSLRSRHPYTVNLLIGGVDPKTGTPELYWLDYLSSCVKLNYAAHGYASYFCMSTMDRYWKPELSVEEAISLLKKCLAELKVRFIGNLPNFVVKITDKDGIREIEI
ncbi:hypothetical protein CcCBS67573_g07902 [Chytriomyces confervae]|uniref:Proteasome subunit beta n=2 Tax=Chytriomyces confervae TaxID=246404 RepID=A0A507ESA5_9FUNG|nr:hypothetical protein CcCBS67573_g07902 [Chytriomyces confervae]